jgi:hypothetical protein
MIIIIFCFFWLSAPARGGSALPVAHRASNLRCAAFCGVSCGFALLGSPLPSNRRTFRFGFIQASSEIDTSQAYFYVTHFSLN